MFFLSSGFRASQTIDLLGTDGIPIKTKQQTCNFKECSVHFSRCPCLSSTVNKAAKIGCRQASGCFSCPQALGLLKLLIYWEQMGSLSRPNNKQRSFLPCLNSCATLCACSSRLSRQWTLLHSTKILSSHNFGILLPKLF